jgi:DNA-binding NarL/FixJ family response regulator
MSPAAAFRVALVDDHEPFRARLRALLERDPEITVVAEAGSGQELLDIARSTEIDVVCMDIRLPGMSGIEATRRLLAMRPGIRVIGLSAYAEPHYAEAMLDAGAVGQFTKGDAGDALRRAIRTATVERPALGAHLVVPSGEHAGAAPSEASSATLGVREVEVLRLIAGGRTPEQIAASLAIDPTMVDVYRRNIMRKLNLTTDAALNEYAIRSARTRDQ